MPLRNPSLKTRITGMIRKSARNTRATAAKMARANGGSVVTDGGIRANDFRSDMAKSPPAPGLNQIDCEQNKESNRQHDHGYRRGSGIVEFLEFDHDQHRCNLRDVRQIARDEDDRAVFTDRSRKREGKPSQ